MGFEEKLIPSLNNTQLVRPSTWTEVGRDQDLQWLDKNENLDPEFLEFTSQFLNKIPVASIATYPALSTLYDKLANWCQVPMESLMLTPGSDGAIRLVFNAFVSAKDSVLRTNPTFAMYSVYCKIFGAEEVCVTYRRGPSGPRLSVAELVKSLEQIKPKLFCLPNPDSPTGTVFGAHDMQTLLEVCARNEIMFLVDEAYHPFHPETVAQWTSTYKNLIVARSFSKAWGCAGLRLGYLVAHPDVMAYLQKLRPMYEVGTVSVAVMEKILDYPDEMQASVSRLEKGRQALLQACDELGFDTIETVGNFQHIHFGAASAKIHGALANVALYRAGFSDECLQGYSRFSLTTPECFEPVIQAIRNACLGQNT